jgi:hypothetical protein
MAIDGNLAAMTIAQDLLARVRAEFVKVQTFEDLAEETIEAATQAQADKLAADAARIASESARNTSQGARDEAQAARDEAIAARDQTLASRNPTLATITVGRALIEADRGTFIMVNAASQQTLTLPNSLPAGFAVQTIQWGAGAILFSPGSGAQMRERGGHTRSAGQNAMVGAMVMTNSSGSNAVWLIFGDTAP